MRNGNTSANNLQKQREYMYTVIQFVMSVYKAAEYLDTCSRHITVTTTDLIFIVDS